VTTYVDLFLTGLMTEPNGSVALRQTP